MKNVLALIVASFLPGTLVAQDLNYVEVGCFGKHCRPYVAPVGPPAVIYRPYTVYQPMQYQGTSVSQIWKPTLFGIGFRLKGTQVQHHYAPAQAPPVTSKYYKE